MTKKINEYRLLQEIRAARKLQHKDVYTKGIKKKTHDTLDLFWKKGWLTRKECYVLVMQVLGIKNEKKAHIRYLSEQQCRQLINAINNGKFDIAAIKQAYRRGLQYNVYHITKGQIRFPKTNFKQKWLFRLKCWYFRKIDFTNRS